MPFAAKIDAAPAIESVRRWRARFRERLRAGFASGAARLLAIVRAKLSGEVLRPKSGALRASLRAAVAEDSAGLAGRVWSEGSLPYARIQEFGGRIMVPELAAQNAKALAFVYGGKLVFARRVRAHAVELPERSYMRSSLADFSPAFVDDIRKVAAEACA